MTYTASAANRFPTSWQHRRPVPKKNRKVSVAQSSHQKGMFPRQVEYMTPQTSILGTKLNRKPLMAWLPYQPSRQRGMACRALHSRAL